MLSQKNSACCSWPANAKSVSRKGLLLRIEEDKQLLKKWCSNILVICEDEESMWLPKDERKLLAHYYCELGQVGVKGRFFLSKLEKCLCRPHTINRVRIASETLARRSLIILMPQGDAITVGLTLEGYDLGRKYSRWLTRSGLWFAEYKYHWIWLILSFLGGIIGALIIQGLKNILFC